jgi:hypothetical protein
MREAKQKALALRGADMEGKHISHIDLMSNQ